MDTSSTSQRILSPVCYQIQPVACIRQLIVFPDANAGRRSSIGLLRHRILLLELADGRIFRLSIDRSWIPTEANISILASALMEHDGLPHDWPYITSNLEWQLDTMFSFERFNLSNSDLDKDATHAAALEHCLGMSANSNANTADMQVTVRNIEQQMSDDMACLLSQFVERLDSNILALAPLWPDGLTLPRYNWLMGSESKSRPWRIQAARVFPALIPVLAGERGEIAQAEQKLIEVIDRGRSLVQAIEKNYGVRKAIARHALSIPAWLLDDARLGRLAVLLRGMLELPPERYPRIEEDWRMYVRLLYELLPSLTGRPASSRLNAAFLPAISRRGWEVTDGKLEQVGLNEEGASLLRNFVAACNRTLAGAIVDVCKVPQTTATILASRVLEAALISIGVVNLANFARQWPTLVGRARLEHKVWWDQLRGKSWPAVIDAPFEGEDCQVIALAGPEELVEEGKVMGNCVGSYVQSCLDGDAFIFSVRRKDGSRLGTAELVFKPISTSDQYRIVIRQFKGHGNSQVSALGARALAAFKHHLEGEDAQASIARVLKDMAQARKWRRQGTAAKRIEHEVRAEAMRQMADVRLRLDTLLVKAIDEQRQEREGLAEEDITNV